MYRVRYLEQTDKMSERVRLRMIEEVYCRELLLACVAAQSEAAAEAASRAALYGPERACGFCSRWCCGVACHKGGCGIN